MYLPAISMGYAVPENFEASVHSVFQSALNLRPSGRDDLLTLVVSGEADLPQGIRVDTPPEFSFETFRTGEPVDCRAGILRLSFLTIELRAARRWKCDLSKPGADPTDPAVSSAWSFVWYVLNKKQTLLNADIVADDLLHTGESARVGVRRKAGEAMRELLKTTRRYELTDVSVVNRLIGLGSGLTPSGDDLLIGYLAGLWCAIRDKEERLRFISDLGEVVIHQSQQTNDISRTYLFHAARGQVSSFLANLAEAICRGADPERLLEITETAMQVGHTSGLDAVTGLLLGLAAWDGEHLLSR